MKKLIRGSRQYIRASHAFISEPDIMEVLSSDLFAFMNDAYKWTGGFKSFTGEDDFADRSYLWYITYDGPLPSDKSELDINKIYTVSVYKQKNGLKLVGIGNNRFSTVEDPEERMILKSKAKDALIQHIRFAVRQGWAEVSGTAEKMFKLAVSPRYIIDPEKLMKLRDFKDIEILPDNLHYSRTLSNGMEVTKIAYGNIQK